ncbi:MAG: glycoside hydrolase family 57 protein [Candidatus Omnitrophica bacterium]|nr:glycoside hydrolase family 57 protein [Candidatus Omnitrophota bacterium]
MVYLAVIFHMHQPYYKNLLTSEVNLPWVRLHGVKDYLDMVEILQEYPDIRQTFNLVPSLMEQIEDYNTGQLKDTFFELSLKPASELVEEEKDFLRKNFFSINRERVISLYPRYYELYFKARNKKEFNTQDYLDLQVWFNLAWIDPSLRKRVPKLSLLVDKGRFFTEEDKRAVLNAQLDILNAIIPGYRRFRESGQIEVTVTPYYHPILPLLYNTNTAKEANPKTILPKTGFAFPQDAVAQINQAVGFYSSIFNEKPLGMWPSEESVSEHILPMIIDSGVQWIVADEAILFKSLRKKRRDTALLYQPHLLKRKNGTLAIVFRDRPLSDLISFVYHSWKTENAVSDFLAHLNNIATAFKDRDVLVVVAMDGENAWEYYRNDGHDFLELLYARLSESKTVKTTTIKDYLSQHPPVSEIKRLAAGSWIYAEFGKWIGHPLKLRAWECLAEARKLLAESKNSDELAWKQMYILEGSDWFWWYGDDPEGNFDRLFRMHLANFYTLINKTAPSYLNKPLSP